MTFRWAKKGRERGNLLYCCIMFQVIAARGRDAWFSLIIATPWCNWRGREERKRRETGNRAQPRSAIHRTSSQSATSLAANYPAPWPSKGRERKGGGEESLADRAGCSSVRAALHSQEGIKGPSLHVPGRTREKGGGEETLSPF